jgi:thiamine transport system ATP-binding protein
VVDPSSVSDSPPNAASSRSAAPPNRLTVDVETAEFLGDTTRLYCRWADRQVVVRTPDVPDADRLDVGFDPAAATFF